MNLHEVLLTAKILDIKNLEKRISALEAETVEKPVYLTQSEFDSLAQTEPETTYFIVGE